MKPETQILMLALLICVIGPASASAQRSTEDIERLAWMSGCWEGVRGERRFEEQWMRPKGGVMLGMSRTSVRDSVVDFESVAILSRAGRTFYRARPENQDEAQFNVKQLSDSTVTFENLAHDFPQRIAYTRTRADSLVAWIEGAVDGNNRRIQFPMKAVPCPGKDS